MTHYIGKSGPITHYKGQSGYPFVNPIGKLSIAKSALQGGTGHFKLGLMLAYNKVLSPTEVEQVVDYINDDLGWNIQERNPPHNIIFDGNSLTEGFGIGENIYTNKVPHDMGLAEDNFKITAFGGATLTQLVARAGTVVDQYYDETKDNNICVIWEITNELDHGPVRTVAAVKALLRQYGLERKATGYKNIFVTCLPRKNAAAGMTDEQFMTNSLDINQYLRDQLENPTNGIPWIDAIADVAAPNNGISAYADVTSPMYIDDVHLGIPGHAIVTTAVKDAIESIF
jgi:hypothetical protein